MSFFLEDESFKVKKERHPDRTRMTYTQKRNERAKKKAVMEVNFINEHPTLSKLFYVKERGGLSSSDIKLSPLEKEKCNTPRNRFSWEDDKPIMGFRDLLYYNRELDRWLYFYTDHSTNKYYFNVIGRKPHSIHGIITKEQAEEYVAVPRYLLYFAQYKEPVFTHFLIFDGRDVWEKGIWDDTIWPFQGWATERNYIKIKLKELGFVNILPIEQLAEELDKQFRFEYVQRHGVWRREVWKK